MKLSRTIITHVMQSTSHFRSFHDEDNDACNIGSITRETIFAEKIFSEILPAGPVTPLPGEASWVPRDSSPTATGEPSSEAIGSSVGLKVDPDGVGGTLLLILNFFSFSRRLAPVIL